MRLERVAGKEGWAMVSLKRRCGSGVMRHIDVLGEVLREWGRAILRGLRRRWSVRNFFAVRTSHMTSASEALGSGELGSVARRFLVERTASCC